MSGAASDHRPIDDAITPSAQSAKIRHSVVVLTFGRDDTIHPTLASVSAAIGQRDDVEVILVDNNPDGRDRTEWLQDFASGQAVKVGRNLGVAARNLGAAAATGEFVYVLDDDVLIETPDAFARFEAIFDDYPDVGVINVRKLEAKDRTQLPECIPHNRKSVDANRPFFTFKIVGGLVAFRRAVFDSVGGYSEQFFFGGEEKEYSYRIIGGGWKIYYTPHVIAIEQHAAGGRGDYFQANTALLANNYKIAFLHKPMPAALIECVALTPIIAAARRGQLSIPGALAAFAHWLRQPDRPRRQPLGRAALAYIRECGGATWR